MSDENRRPFLKLVTGTRLGRMILLATAVTLVLFALSGGFTRGRKAPVESGTSEKTGSTDATDPGALPPSPSGFDESLPVAQQYKALVSSFGERVASTEKELQATRKELETLRSAIEDERAAKKKEGDARSTAVPAHDPLHALRERQEEDRRAADPGAPPRLPAEAAPPLPGGVRSIEFPKPAEGKKEPGKFLRIPAAAGGEATLLNGVFAPITGEPSPVRLRLDAALLGPNRSRVPLRDALLIGKAVGDANASRVTIQLEKLATVKETGESVEVKVLGYVVGDDGQEGVPGSYEWRAAEYLPLAGVAGALSYGVEALADRETTASVTPLGGATRVVTGDPLRFAGFRAAAGASGKVGDLVVERMREIRPAVSTPAGRRVQVVFLEGVTLEGFTLEDTHHARESNPFGGLDLDR